MQGKARRSPGVAERTRQIRDQKPAHEGYDRREPGWLGSFHWCPFVVTSFSAHRSSSSLNRRLFPKRKDEKPRRSSVRIPSVADNSAIQTRVASGKSIGISAYLLMSRTAAASASALNASLTSVALASEKRARLAAPSGTSERK